MRRVFVVIHKNLNFYKYVFFFSTFFCGDSVTICGATGTICFGLWLTQPMGFKARVDASLPVLEWCRLCVMHPRLILSTFCFPYRYKEKGNIEAHFFSIQTNLKAQGLRYYQPPEGKLVNDIERAWVFLEKAEHDRELALREEMIR